MRIKFIVTLLLFTSILAACSKQTEIIFKNSELDQYRPLYHFTPDKGWMNDPNGLVYLNGEYHLFYQYYPDSTVWGPMHWGHASSKDLVNWEKLPIALYPDSLGYIFSGSAVYDQDNSSSLGSSENPPLVAIYTYHNMDAEKSGRNDYQSQALAFSIDKGKSWKKYENNPVLSNPGIKDFRDPKVTSITNPDGTKSWLMTLAVAHHINFYSSPNLKDWTLLSEFGQNVGAHGGVWECPDLIPMKSPSGEEKWVLLVSINPGGPQKGSATQYFIGEFENGVFTPDDTLIRWLDYGPDNYAGVTWSNLPTKQDRVLFIGWMSNWLYGQSVPTQLWRSAMTLPRELSLFEVDETLLLKSSPAKELTSLRKETYTINDFHSLLPSPAFEISGAITNEENFSITFSNELGEKLSISKGEYLISIDRRYAGISDFNSDFAGIYSAPFSWNANSFRIFVDSHSIELFINEGELAMTTIVFPTSPWKNVEFSTNLTELKIYNLEEK